MTAKPCIVHAVELDIDCDRYPEISRALAYWREKKGDRELPGRADIDPVDFAAYLPRVMMVEVAHDPLEFRYRLAGTGVFRMHGEELTHKLARDLRPPEFGKLIHAHYCGAVRRRAPVLHEITLDADGVKASYVRIILPLAGDGTTIDRLLTVESYQDNFDELQRFFEIAQD
jgi:hypothetical protein